MKFFYYFPFQEILFLLLIVIICLVVYINIKVKAMQKKGREKIFMLFSTKFNKCLINCKEDIINIINSINREFNTNFSLISILEDYNIFIDDKNVNNINDIHIFIRNLIENENREKPFKNVPDEERRILKNISDNVCNNRLDIIENDLKELSSVVATRNKNYEKTNNINKWSLPIAIIGTIIAIIFGILSFKNIDYNRIEESNKKLLENYSK